MLDRLQRALADRYRIERELGAGGMATVYLAFDRKHDRRVALKVLKPELAAVLGAERFVVEIKTTASLQHPHILPLFDSGTADGFLYYVMPFIEGETLREKLNRETQLGVDEAVRIACDVGEALHYAHSRGVIHRDIKPENILLANGRPLVADFGIALAVSAAAGGRMTETGLSLGTPHYMSPEQATAEKEITARSDVYSLGSVLYEMLAGQPPHLGGSAQQIIMKIIAEPVQRVTALRKSVPVNVAAAVAKSLEKLPADRFQTAQAFIDALTNVAFTDPILAAEVGRSTRRPRRALAFGIVGAIAGAIIASAFGGHAVTPVSESRTRLTFSGRTMFPAISPDGQFMAFVDMNCRHAQIICEGSLLVQEVRGERAQAIITGAGWLGDPRFTHDGSTIVIAGQIDSLRSGLFAIPRLGGTPRRISSRGAPGQYDVHPRGDTVVLISPNDSSTRVELIDINSGRVTDSIRFAHGVGAIAWAGTGGHFATVGRIFRIFDRAGRLTDSAGVHGRPILRRAPGGAIMMFQSGIGKEDELVRVPVGRSGRAGTPDTVLSRFPTLFRGHFDISPQTGDLLVSTGEELFDIWTFDLDRRDAPLAQRTRSTAYYGISELDPEGKTLFYLRADAVGDNLYAVPLGSSSEDPLTALRTGARDFSHVSADGRRIVTSHFDESNRVTVTAVDLATRRTMTRFVDSIGANIWPLADGSLLSAWGTGVLLSDSIGRAMRRIAPDTIRELQVLAPSPDGRRAAIIANVKGVPGVSIVTIDLSSGNVESVVPLGKDEVTAGVAWLMDGTVVATLWRRENDWPTVWRVNARGTLELAHTIRVACEPAIVSIARSGTRGTCTVRDARSDLWLYHGLALRR